MLCMRYAWRMISLYLVELEERIFEHGHLILQCGPFYKIDTLVEIPSLFQLHRCRAVEDSSTTSVSVIPT